MNTETVFRDAGGLFIVLWYFVSKCFALDMKMVGQTGSKTAYRRNKNNRRGGPRNLLT